MRAGNFLPQVLLYEHLGNQPPFPHQMQTSPCLHLLLGLKELPSLTAARSFMPSPQRSASTQSHRTAPAAARGEDRKWLYTRHQGAPASQLPTAAAPAAPPPHPRTSRLGNLLNQAQVLDSAKLMRGGLQHVHGEREDQWHLSSDEQIWVKHRT